MYNRISKNPSPFRYLTKCSFFKNTAGSFGSIKIKYRPEPRMDSHFHRLMSTYDCKYKLFRINPKLQDYRNLKELYVQFNSRNDANPFDAQQELDALISS